MRVQVPCDQKLVNVTWKDDDIWYLTRPMDLAEDPSVLTFQEKSKFGSTEGKITLTEARCGE